MRKFLPFAVLLGACISTGCSSNECYENHSALPLADFYSASTMQKVTLTGLTVYGIGAPGDSILYIRQNLSQAYLPFRIWEDSTSYVFAYYGLVSEALDDDENVVIPTDTITFRYEPKEWFVSPACGAMYFYDMKSASHTSLLIDSIAFNSIITNENTSNIKIFFKEVVANE